MVSLFFVGTTTGTGNFLCEKKILFEELNIDTTISYLLSYLILLYLIAASFFGEMRKSSSSSDNNEKLDVASIRKLLNQTKSTDTSVSEVLSVRHNFHINDKVFVNSGTIKRYGKIKFIGATKFQPGTWVGVELDAPAGKNDGSYQGTRYFQCKPLYGVFVRPGSCTKATNTSEEVVAQEPPKPAKKLVRRSSLTSEDGSIASDLDSDGGFGRTVRTVGPRRTNDTPKGSSQTPLKPKVFSTPVKVGVGVKTSESHAKDTSTLTLSEPSQAEYTLQAIDTALAHTYMSDTSPTKSDHEPRDMVAIDYLDYGPPPTLHVDDGEGATHTTAKPTIIRRSSFSKQNTETPSPRSVLKSADSKSSLDRPRSPVQPRVTFAFSEGETETSQAKSVLEGEEEDGAAGVPAPTDKRKAAHPGATPSAAEDQHNNEVSTVIQLVRFL